MWHREGGEAPDLAHAEGRELGEVHARGSPGKCRLQARLAGLVGQVRGAVWSGACARLLALREKERHFSPLSSMSFFTPI